MSVLDDFEESVLAEAREELGLNAEQRAARFLAFNAQLSGAALGLSDGLPEMVYSPIESGIAELSASKSSPSSAVLWLGRVNPLLLLGSGLIVGGVLGVYGTRWVGDATPSRLESNQMVNVVPQDAVPAVGLVPGVQGENTALALEELSVEAAPSLPVSVKNSSAPNAMSPADRAPPKATFYEELSFLRQAQAALHDGQPARALGLMQALDARQQAGALGLERRVTKALALCGLDRPAEARAEAAPLFVEQNDSVYARRLNETCARPPAATDETEKSDQP
jgi:hypothetical protein